MPRNTTDVSGQGPEMLNTTIGSGEDRATPAIHLTLQGKGGVGKSLVASILAQILPPSRRGNPLSRYRSGEPDFLAIHGIGCRARGARAGRTN